MIEVSPKHQVPCPSCGRETGRHYDEKLKATGKRVCLFPLTCPKGTFQVSQ